MEIKGPGRVETSAIKRKAPAGAASSGFAVSDTPESHAQIVAGPGPIAALDSILMLQGMDDSTQGKSARPWRHGRNSIAGSRWIRCATACSPAVFPAASWNKLAAAVTRGRHEAFADPKLQDVLDQIELRAHVELAKLGAIGSARRPGRQSFALSFPRKRESTFFLTESWIPARARRAWPE